MLFPLSISPTLARGNVRGGIREKSAPREGLASWSPGPHRSPRPGPAGGFPGLNGTAGELDRGRVSAAKARQRLGKGKNVNPVKRSGERIHILNTPPPTNRSARGVGAAGRGSGGESKNTRYSRRGGAGQKVNTHEKRRRRWKGGERVKDGVGGAQSSTWGPPHTTVRARARRDVSERPALSSGPAPSFLWAAGGDSDRPPPFPCRAGGKGVCVCVNVLGGGPGVHPEAYGLPRTP